MLVTATMTRQRLPATASSIPGESVVSDHSVAGVSVSRPAA